MRSVTGAGQSQGKVSCMDSLMQTGGEGVPGSRGSRGVNETVYGEIGPFGLPPPSNLGVPGDPEHSDGM